MAERIHEYECFYLANPELNDDQARELMERVNQLVASFRGEVLEHQIWDRRQLAYPIEKKTEGLYILMRMRLPAQSLNEFREAIKGLPEVMRQMIIRLDE